MLEPGWTIAHIHSALAIMERPYFGGDILASAVDSNSLELVKTLLGWGADANWRYSMDDATALESAFVARNDEIIYQIMEAGADVNAPACLSHDLTARQQAASMGSRDYVQTLLQKGADVNTSSSKVRDVTTLQATSINEHLSITILLLDAGANINSDESKENGRIALEGAEHRISST